MLLQLLGDERPEQVFVLLGTELVNFMRVELPKGAPRNYQTLLPYLVEDELAQDVENIACLVLGKEGRCVDVAIVEREIISSLLSGLSEIGLKAHKLIPDALLLPLREGVTKAKLGSKVLLRKGIYQGASLPESMQTLFLTSDWLQQDGQRLSVNELAMSEATLLQTLSQQAVISPINLLQGAFQTKSSWFSTLKQWRLPISLMVLCLFVWAGNTGFNAYQQSQLANQYLQQSEQRFRAIFPDKQRIPTVGYLRRELERERTRLSNGEHTLDVLANLERVGAVLSEHKRLKLTRYSFDADNASIRLDVIGNDFADFEALRVALGQLFTVDAGPLSRDDKQVKGSFALQANGGGHDAK